jgi:hypothetical protein
MSCDQEQAVWRQLRDALAAAFTGKQSEERRAAALMDGSPWLIQWIVRPKRGSGASVPFERWPEFSNTLLALAESRPTIGVPLVVGLAVKAEGRRAEQRDGAGERAPDSNWTWEFDAETAQHLLVHQRLMPLLSAFEVPEDTDPEMKSACRAAADAAREKSADV